MKIVLISDTHGFECPVPDGDVLVHAGDLTMSGTVTQVSQASYWLNSLPHKHKIVIAGNHDWLFERNRVKAVSLLGDKITYLQDSGIEIDGVKFWGSPVQPIFFNWAFNRGRGEDIRQHWDLIPRGTDVLITHGPPRGILDQASAAINTEHCGCDDLLTALNWFGPKIHVFGHIHGGYGMQKVMGNITCYNASIVNEAYKPVNQPWVVEL